jgi:hypothetical protein
MTTNPRLTLAERELILRLRVEIKTAGLTQTRIAELLGYPLSKVRAQLSGKRPLSVQDITVILTACGWPAQQLAAVLRIGENTNTPDVLWLEPDEVCTSLIAYSRDVTRAIHVAPTMLPWPVHINDYTWTTTLKTGGSTDLLDRWAIVRPVWTWRWEYHNEPMTGVVFIHEHTLQPLTGDPLMVRQLRALARMAEFPGLSLRVIPTHTGIHAAINGPFTLLRFTQWTPLVLHECGNAAVITSTPEAIRDAHTVINRLNYTALDEHQSREMITRLWHDAAHTAAHPWPTQPGCDQCGTA